MFALPLNFNFLQKSLNFHKGENITQIIVYIMCLQLFCSLAIPIIPSDAQTNS